TSDTFGDEVRQVIWPQLGLHREFFAAAKSAVGLDHHIVRRMSLQPIPILRIAIRHFGVSHRNTENDMTGEPSVLAAPCVLQRKERLLQRRAIVNLKGIPYETGAFDRHLRRACELVAY